VAKSCHAKSGDMSEVAGIVGHPSDTPLVALGVHRR
jgi:hypothetical protein